jgi:hypothetical protein
MMKENDVFIRRVDANPSAVELCMTDDTIRRYPLNKVHEYANQKTASITDLEKFQNIIDRDYWFTITDRKPTLRVLAEEYLRTIGTDTDCPLTVLVGMFMPDGANTPRGGQVLLDGTHRLLKCLITGRKTVSVVEVTAGELLRHVAEIDRQ